MSPSSNVSRHDELSLRNMSATPVWAQRALIAASQARGVAAQSASRSSTKGPHIVAIGGGTGLPAVLRGLVACLGETLTPEQITALVTVTDDGGSSGKLRRELQVLPPGDVRNCLAALADPATPVPHLLQHRFGRGNGLRGHPVGNLMLAALTEMTGDLATAVELVSQMFCLCGRVLPSTHENVCLRAEFAGGTVVEGETAIVAEHRPIVRLSLERPVRPLPEAVRALINADAIVVGPGSLYTSILPNLLIDGIASTIYGVRAVRIFVANLMTEPGETDGFTLGDHLRVIWQHTGFDLFDYVIVNQLPLDSVLTQEYEQRGSFALCSDGEEVVTRARIIRRNLAAEVQQSKIRHAPQEVATAILELIRQGRP